MATCEGRKKDGMPCRSPIVLDNSYCRAHQDQASQATAPEKPVRWTRERMEAAQAILVIALTGLLGFVVGNRVRRW